jgi:cyclophilin family peptidyl-prolyl cis-trans isomerase
MIRSAVGRAKETRTMLTHQPAEQATRSEPRAQAREPNDNAPLASAARLDVHPARQRQDIHIQALRMPNLMHVTLVALMIGCAVPAIAQPQGKPKPSPQPPAKMGPAKTGPAKPTPAADPRPAAKPRVRLNTTVGSIVLELYPEKAPVTVKNFLEYVRSGFYDGLVFHRVVPDFMIQAGGYDAEMNPRRKGVRPPIKNESANLLKNERGTIAMARLNDPHSATTQFFINVVNNPHLDRSKTQPYGYAVFGKVVEGMGTVDRIRRTPCKQHPQDPRKGQDGPVNPDPPIVIVKAQLVGEPPLTTGGPRIEAGKGSRPGRE